MFISPSAWLHHALDEVRFLASATAVGKAAFLADETLKRAVVRSLQVLAAAVRQLPADWKAAHPRIDWDRLATLPERIIHEDFGVDYELAWDLATERLPELADELSILVLDR